jgi:hypothetical protein
MAPKIEVPMQCIRLCSVMGIIALQATLAVALQPPQNQMPATESRAFTDAATQATPESKASALEAYLANYPRSPLREEAIRGLVSAYSEIGTAALNRKDAGSAIEAFKKELTAASSVSATTSGQVLADTYGVALAYFQSKPPDLVNCTFYATRFVAYAQEPEKSNVARLAEYCYKKYHGAAEGYERVVAAAKANLNPPASFVIERAPEPRIFSGPIPAVDIATLPLSDKEFVLRNGHPDDAEKVWQTMKDKTIQIPDALVIDVSTRFIKVAVSDEAVASKTADFLLYMKSIKPKTPLVGSKVTLAGIYDSFTQNPLLVVLREGVILSPPARRTTSSSSGK